MFNNPDNREDNTEALPHIDGEYRFTAANNPGASGNVYNAADNAQGQNPNAGSYNAPDSGAQQPNYGGNTPNYQYNNRQQQSYGGYTPNYQYQSEPEAPTGGKRRRTKTPKPPKPPREKKPMGAGAIVALALVCAILGGIVGGGAVYAVSGGTIVNHNTSVAVSDRKEVSANLSAETVKAGDPMTSSQIYNTYSDSVVCITVEASGKTGAGTGFIISNDGYIMTCAHVVEGATAISVTLNNTTSYEAKLVGSDSQQDFAIIKIEPGEDPLVPVVLGDSGILTVGDNVTVIGNALGTLANTLTTGVVSALDRAITMSDGSVMRLMQTDCTINSGNSGGPMFNQYGEVIGIVNAKYSSSTYGSSGNASIEGIGFAIPINSVNDITGDLMKYGYVTGKPYLGISVSTVNAVTAQQYSNMVVGAYVNSVNQGSCAETAGLKVGDIITQVDGTDITTSAELIDAKNAHKAGEQMTMTVYRPVDGATSDEANYQTIVVTLDEETPESHAATEEQPNGQNPNGGNDYDYGYNYGGNGNGGSGSYSWPFGSWPFGYGW